MSVEKYFARAYPFLFGLLAFFATIELAISAWLTSRFIAHHDESAGLRDRTAFALFASIWTLVFSALYLFFFLSKMDTAATSMLGHFIFFFLSWVFWTAAAASITDALGGGLDCATQNAFVYCGQLNALEAFAWICWVFVTMAIIAVMIKSMTSMRAGKNPRSQLLA